MLIRKTLLSSACLAMLLGGCTVTTGAALNDQPSFERQRRLRNSDPAPSVPAPVTQTGTRHRPECCMFALHAMPSRSLRALRDPRITALREPTA